MSGSIVKLYTVKGHHDSQDARELLDAANIEVVEIDVRSTGIIAYLQRDLGAKSLPVALTSDGVLTGIEDIRTHLAQH